MVENSLEKGIRLLDVGPRGHVVGDIMDIVLVPTENGGNAIDTPLALQKCVERVIFVYIDTIAEDPVRHGGKLLEPRLYQRLDLLARPAPIGPKFDDYCARVFRLEMVRKVPHCGKRQHVN